MYRVQKSSLSSILATVTVAAILINSSKFILDNHSLLNLTTVFSRSNTLNICSQYVKAFSLTCSSVSAILPLDFPVGSPILPVKSPITITTVWPKSCICFSFLSTTAWPIWISGADGSSPSLIISGLLCLYDFSSFSSNSSSFTHW